MKRATIFLFFLSVYTFLFFPLTPLLAQEVTLPDTDITAPIIQHEPPSQTAPAGKPLVIEATITDNVAVKEATLFYRAAGGSEYSSIKMEKQGNDLYSASIPEKDVLEPRVEYYIQASDNAGNIVQRGFAFSPLVVAVGPAPVPSEEMKTPTAEGSPTERLAMRTEEQASKPWYKKWWVWTIVGVAVVGGAVAAAAGGGGGGGGAPSTGSATISGPTP